MALKRHVSTSTTAPGAPVATVVRHSAHGRLPSLRGVHRRRLSTWATVADDVDVDGQQPKGLVEGSYLHQGERCPYWKIPGARPSSSPPVVLVHPVGVGLAKWFWIPLMIALQTKSFDSDVYAPDLLGTGGCSAYKAYQGSSSDLAGEWADQLRSFIANEVQEPAVVVTQGALGTVGIELAAGSNNTNLVKGLVMSTPPSWEAVSSEFNPLVRGAIWNLLTWPGGHSPFGKAFYQYASTEKFLRQFSSKNLFSSAEKVTDAWITKIISEARPADRRFAIIAFLSGLWRRDRVKKMGHLPKSIPVLV
uniref:AB hydrolase-1 domain-containing protein n=1 Tax=Lotharella globosa TaxID=91324 RepID=A0A7S3Z0S9_9EUKA|mmetsp:Transcript_30255/g.58280  ORF Transcript_30255/g.58280 Transcript_30255/m.58280 type:complete len:306 (+) Transcript_30255:54-971(+)